MAFRSSDRDIYLNTLVERIHALPEISYPALNAYTITHGLMIPPWWVRLIVRIRSWIYRKESTYSRWGHILSYAHQPKYADETIKFNNDLVQQTIDHISDDGFDNTELNKLEAGILSLERVRDAEV